MILFPWTDIEHTEIVVTHDLPTADATRLSKPDESDRSGDAAPPAPMHNHTVTDAPSPWNLPRHFLCYHCLWHSPTREALLFSQSSDM